MSNLDDLIERHKNKQFTLHELDPDLLKEAEKLKEERWFGMEESAPFTKEDFDKVKAEMSSVLSDEPIVVKTLEKLATIAQSQSPVTIKELEAICKQHDLQALVAVAVHRDGTINVSSYGESKKKCSVIGEWAQGLWKWAIAREPFCGTFGWGSGGSPKDG